MRRYVGNGGLPNDEINTLDTIYKTGNSINGPTTNAIAINSLFGKDFIAIASASGELRANVVRVKLT